MLSPRVLYLSSIPTNRGVTAAAIRGISTTPLFSFLR